MCMWVRGGAGRLLFSPLHQFQRTVCEKRPQRCSSQQSSLSFERRYIFVNSVSSFTCRSSKATQRERGGGGVGWIGGGTGCCWEMWFTLPTFRLMKTWKKGRVLRGSLHECFFLSGERSCVLNKPPSSFAAVMLARGCHTGGYTAPLLCQPRLLYPAGTSGFESVWVYFLFCFNAPTCPCRRFVLQWNERENIYSITWKKRRF